MPITVDKVGKVVYVWSRTSGDAVVCPVTRHVETALLR